MEQDSQYLEVSCK